MSTGVSKPARAAPKRRHVHAGLGIDVGVTSRLLRARRPTAKYGDPAVVMVAGVLDYLVARIVKAAGEISTGQGKKTILLPHVLSAMEREPDLARILASQTGGGNISKLTKILPKDISKDGVKKAPGAKKEKKPKKAKPAAEAEAAASS